MPPAGKVAIQFEVNANSFSSGMDKVTKQLKDFQGKTIEAGHSTVSSMQAASASIRLLENPLGNNIRAIERLVSQSKLLSGVMQAAFPVVGAVALGAAIARLGTEVAEFYKKTAEMPKNITAGFREMNSAAQMSNDTLKLTNDRLQNEIDKLNGKPQNNLAIAIDESRIASDKLAASLAQSAKQVKDLLSSNSVEIMQQLFAGKGSTADVAGSVNSYRSQLSDLAFKQNQATRSGDTTGAANYTQQIVAKEKSYSAWLDAKLATITGTVQGGVGVGPIAYSSVHGNQDANIAILQGEKMLSNDRADQNTEEGRNPGLEAGKASAQQAAEARRKEAEEMAKGWATSLELAKQADELARDMATFASESNNDMFKTAGVSSDDNNSLTKSGASTNAWITSLRAGFDAVNANKTAIAESSIQMALMTGNMSKMDAAQALSTLHLQEYNEQLVKLKSLREAITGNTHISDTERKAQLNNNQTATDNLNANYQMQSAQDNQSTNPMGSSAGVGFADALDSFVDASKDAAGQMKELTDSTLKGLNAQLVAAMSGQKTDFKGFGAGVFRNVAGTALNKAEGSALSAFGFGGKQGTQSNPLWVKIADGVGGVTGSVGSGIASGIGKLFGAGSSDGNSDGSGGFMSALKGIVPFLATGGSIDGPSVVGEQGPELFVPGSSGHIVPNHKLSSIGGGNSQTIHIDARGSNDPAQVHAVVQRAIMEAAPHIMAGAVHMNRSISQRKPSSAR